MVEKRLSIGGNIAWNSVGSIFYLACQWILTVLVVRLSDGYDAAGLLALGMSVSNIFTPFGQYKIRAFQVSDVHEEYSPGQYVALRVVTIAIAVLVMVLYGLATCPTDTLPAVYTYGIYSLGPIFADVLHGVDQQRSRMDIIGKSFIIRGALSVASFSAILILTNSLEASFVGMSIVTFAALYLFDWRKTVALGVNLSPDFSSGPLLKLLRTCFPAVVALFFCSAVPSIPRQVLGGMYGESALGAYASIAAPVLIIQMGAQYLYAPLMGVFAERFEDASLKGFYSLLAKVTLGIAGITIAGIAGFAVFGEWLFSVVFGAGITEYLYLLLPLVVCTALSAYVWFLGDLLIVVRDFKGNLVGYLIAFVACLATVYPALTLWGLNGASYAIIIAFGLGLACFLLRVMKACRQKRGEVK